MKTTNGKLRNMVVRNSNALALFLLLSTLFFTASVSAELSTYPREDFWIADGPVNSIVPANGLLYLGGEFSSVGPLWAFGSEVDTTDGLITQDSPRINDATLVRAVASDGQGGWLIAYQNETTNQIIRILANNTLDPNWQKTANSSISAIVVEGEEVYLGGGFSAVYDANGGIPRSGVARFDLSTGEPSPWNPNILASPGQPYVSCLAASGTDILIGGSFSSVQGIARRNLAAVNRISGQPTTWNPSPDRSVNRMAIDGNIVYVAGGFTVVGGLFRSNLAAISLSTGFSTPWNPDPDGGVGAIIATSGLVYVSGSFTNIGGATRQGLVELDKTTGLATAWYPSPTPAIVSDLGLIDDRLFVVGSFNTIAGEPRVGGAAFDLPTEKLTGWNPHIVGGASRLISTSEDAAYLGGDFRSLNGKTRKGLAALDATSGIATSWAPSVDGLVAAAALDNGIMYVGGTFETVESEARANLAAVDIRTGDVTPWNPGVDARAIRPGSVVNVIEIDDSTLYIGGSFTNIGGAERNNVAAVDLTGSTTSWGASATQGSSQSSAVFSLLADDGLLYVGGLFNQINGQGRNGLGAVRLDTGEITPFAPQFENASWVIRGLLRYGNNLITAGTGTRSGGNGTFSDIASSSLADSVVAWEENVEEGYDWASLALEILDGTIYRGGYSIRTYNPDTGAQFAWDSSVNGPVRAITFVGNSMFAGGAFSSVHGAPIVGLAVFPSLRATRLVPLGMQNGAFLLQVTGEPDAVNVLKRTPDFGKWAPVSTNIGPFFFESPSADNTPTGFYRVDVGQ